MTTVSLLLDAVAGADVRQRIRQSIEFQDWAQAGEGVHRRQLAAALAGLLFDDLIQRVPQARAYVAETQARGRKVCLDHGALRTVDGCTGELPAGDAAFARILEPLGYRRSGVYPLPGLRMTGRVFTHEDAPEQIAQYFVSELHLARFSPAFQHAAARVMATTRDPLPAWAFTLLERLRRDREIRWPDAVALLPVLLRCFGRHHEPPERDDYETLLSESAEMAWYATEGNVFNHATDRVEDIRAVAEQQRRLGRPLKSEIEVSASGRVLQTAFRAAPVRRRFRCAAGFVEEDVPGSFYEFIQRKPLPDGRLDLAFDSGNAAGIFTMTRVADLA